LPEAIKRAGQKWAEGSGIPCEVNTTGQVAALHPQVEIALLRAVQEALNNIRKHAKAGEVCVTLTYFEDMVVLDVQDNGQGFDPTMAARRSSKHQNGYGLTAMRERVEKLNGKLLVESAPGDGTTLVIEIPVSS
jgi:signal transduction histidine kinase